MNSEQTIELSIENFFEHSFQISDEKENAEAEKSQALFSILPIQNVVSFPDNLMQINVATSSSIQLLREAYQKNELIGTLTYNIQGMVGKSNPKDLYSVGTLVRIQKIIEIPGRNFITVVLLGLNRFKIEAYSQTKPYLKAKIKVLKETLAKTKTKEMEMTLVNIRETIAEIMELRNKMPSADKNIMNFFVDKHTGLNQLCFYSSLSTEKKQKLLQIDNSLKKATDFYKELMEERANQIVKFEIHERVSLEMDKSQKEFYLNHQLKEIQEELGGNTEEIAEKLIAKFESKNANDEVRECFFQELDRLKRINANSPDYSVQRNYLDFFVSLPWNVFSKDNFDIPKANKILNRDHFGLDDIKKRILEQLAVLKLKNNMKSPILCFYGPPGVGKTSLGKSIADALGRKYVRISLGGVHDESEIRGHRKTYIGAMSGRILKAIAKSGTSNPVLVLDEIDKLGSGHQGNPSAALLEVLDPEQNHSFQDNFLELGYDLSKVMFIATANSLSSIERPLLDRMEIIELSGYTLEEKVQIAKKYLHKKQLEANGLEAKAFELGPKELQHIIEAHTSESGVRGLEKSIAKVCRWVAYQLAMNKEYVKKINNQQLDEILGVPRYKSKAEKIETTGVVTGLAWTSVGGDILMLESVLSKGKGTISFTGNLGTVMKESITIAFEFIKAKHESLGISLEKLQESNLHLHVPEGATPKDGPSAGIGMLTSMVSTLIGKKVKSHLAMTGEITLRGKVLPVGGIKEKLLAAIRAGITTVILCQENEKDVLEINSDFLKNLNICYVSQMSEVIDLALEK